jgi:hypothetical protein
MGLFLMKAYQKQMNKECNDAFLPGVDLSQDELFFVNFAQLSCTKSNHDTPGKKDSKLFQSVKEFRCVFILKQQTNVYYYVN